VHCVSALIKKVSRIRIFNRNLKQVLIAVTKPKKIIGIARIFILIKRPLRFLHYYLWFQTDSIRSFREMVEIRTPLGQIRLITAGKHDYVTIFEVFCRQDYKLKKEEKYIIDVGSNIGISAAYFLSRNLETKVFCYEPNPENLKYLHTNLESFSTRLEIHPVALGNLDDTLPFAVEKTGRYGTLLRNQKDLGEYIQVPVRNIICEIEKVISGHGYIHLIKIDTEGTEPELIELINDSHLSGFRILAENNMGGITEIFLNRLNT
jgi:FkbM family methyltransferase